MQDTMKQRWFSQTIFSVILPFLYIFVCGKKRKVFFSPAHTWTSKYYWGEAPQSSTNLVSQVTQETTPSWWAFPSQSPPSLPAGIQRTFFISDERFWIYEICWELIKIDWIYLTEIIISYNLPFKWAHTQSWPLLQLERLAWWNSKRDKQEKNAHPYPKIQAWGGKSTKEGSTEGDPSPVAVSP